MTAAFLQLLFLLAAGHAVADFPLQGAEMASAKRPGGHATIAWPMALGCHALIHGWFVALAMIAVGRGGYWWLGVVETVAHVAIDGGKCRRWYGMRTDQALHLMCKVAWAAIAVVLA